MDELPRRANPPGWTAPKAPYNPYDPTDLRPPQGYPSEFATPASATHRAATHYDQMRDTMRRLQYVPRPHSELYKSQFKVLRRVENYRSFNRGLELTAKVLMGGVVLYGVFIHRWNDGQENIFSAAYRLRLQAQYLLTGVLSPRQQDDLELVRQPTNIRLGMGNVDAQFDEKYGLERPQRKHVVEVERRLQLEEEEKLKTR